MRSSRVEQISRLFVELADTLVDDFDVVEFLQQLTESSLALLEVDAAGVMLADQRGGLQLVASSPTGMRSLELFELQVAEGPCLDTFASGERVVNVTLAQARVRWPTFAPVALRDGMASTHALPLRLRGQVVGAINLFSHAEQPLSDADIALGQALADVATIGLLQQRAIREQSLLAEQLQSALNSRVLIEQAKGMLAERAGITPTVAFAQLRTYARTTQQNLHDVAQQVLNGQLLTLQAG